jgi:aminopeptidase N
MTNSNWDDMWLHEGLGSYMQPLYMQYLRGDQEYFASLMRMRASIANKAALVSGKPRTGEGEEADDQKRGGPGLDLYVKGALVMHTLRGLVGDDALPGGATWTLDPNSKLLRRAKHIEQFQEYEKTRKKTKTS